jgi:hypothetical protein
VHAVGFEPTTAGVRDLRYNHLAKRDMTIADEKNKKKLFGFNGCPHGLILKLNSLY